MDEIKRKAALITGGAKRIGAGIAVELAKDGYDIAIHYNTSEAEAIETQNEIKHLGRECSIFKGNLKDLSFINELVMVAFSTFPHLNVLINSASTFKRAEIINTTPHIFDELINVNLRAPFFLIKEFAKFCEEGNIINILDTKTAKYQNVYSAYILSRTALLELTEFAAVEFAPKIRSNGICPGLILPNGNEDEEYVKRLETKIPLGKKGNIFNITETVKFLLNNDFITGEIIYVDGGENLK
ncbi:MAG: SDR family oxidoreductase [Candidatus Delongbacteria bacterium]|nr:SDR family oxidoreductase [Candidatus Delongbacteria bacterium]MCG2760066.1 SDR family oxidoreductase [Candidatus Delongbacteria bacterium]